MRRFFLAPMGAVLVGIPSSGLAQTASIRGLVYDSLISGGPLAGATVELLEIGRRGVTDGRGVYRLDSLPPGTYTLSFGHPSFEAIRFAPPERSVTIAPGVDISLMLTTPAPTTIYRRLCPGPSERNSGVLLGTATDATTDSALAGAEVRAEWTEATLGRGEGFVRRPKVVRAGTDQTGRYQLCGVPTDVPVLLRLLARGNEGPPLELVMADRLLAVRQLTLDVSGASGGTGRSRVAGRITSAGQPIANAQITLLGINRVARTDNDGAFLMDGLPAGTHTVEARAIGYGRRRQDVQLRPDRPITLALALDRLAVELPEITVRGRAPSTMIAGFEQRRLQGVGSHFITREDILRRGSIRVEDLFRGLAGVRVERIGAADYQIVSTRGGAGFTAMCIPTVYVDGIRIPSDPETGNNLPVIPEEIAGIEIHQSLSTAPLEYRPMGQSCGVILIWSRRTT